MLARPSCWDILRLSPTEGNPPLSTFAYRFWIAIFGSGETALESLAVVFGLASLVVIHRLASEVYDEATAHLSLVLAAISPSLVSVSQQVRSYSLAVLLGALSALFLVRRLKHDRPRDRVAFLVASYLFLNTHYYALLVLFAFFLHMWIRCWPTAERRNQAIRDTLLLGLVSVPTLVALYLQYTRYRNYGWIPPPDLSLLGGTFTALAGGSVPLFDLFLLLAGIALVTHARARDIAPAVPLLLWLLVPPAIALVVSLLGWPFLFPRYAVLWVVPFLLIGGRGIAVVRSLPLRVALLAIACAVTVPVLSSYYEERRSTSVEQEASDLASVRRRPGEAILHLTKDTYIPALVHHGFPADEFLMAGASTSNVMRYWMTDRQVEIRPEELARFDAVWVFIGPDLSPDPVHTLLATPALAARAPRVEFLGPDGRVARVEWGR